jgi:hypothetical protein
MFVPPRPRVRIEDQGYELRITIPPRRDAATVAQWAFLTFWLCGWAVGETMVGWMALTALFGSFGGPEAIGQPPEHPHGPAGFALLFMLFWLCGWTVGGLMAINHWLHLMWGRELIVVDGNTLAVTTFPLHRLRQYAAREVSALRVGTHALQQTRQWNMPQRHTGGGIAFTYAGQEQSFGATLDPSEAENVISEIGRRYKWMAPPAAQGEEHV